MSTTLKTQVDELKLLKIKLRKTKMAKQLISRYNTNLKNIPVK